MTTPTKTGGKRRGASMRPVYDDFGDLQGYAPVATRAAQAEAAAQRLSSDGLELKPIKLAGKGPKGLASTPWGRAWCLNIERYSEYAHVLPRGRSLIRNGCVLDLRIEQGLVTAIVYGGAERHVTIKSQGCPEEQWDHLKHKCAGAVSSLGSLLQGAIPAEIMTEMTQPEGGLMPTPNTISFSCDCTDWAELCEHGAAALYGVAVRLDTEPDLLFHWNGVDPRDIITATLDDRATSASGETAELLPNDDLGSLFGIDLE